MRHKPATFAALAAALALAAAPAGAESRLEKSLRLPPGGSFRLDTDLGSVTVTGKSGPGARIVVTSRRDLNDLMRFRFQEGPRSVTVTGRKRRLFSWFDSGRVRYQIEVPAETSLQIETSGGKISVASMRSRAKLATSGGGIAVDGLAGDLDARTSGGSIRLRDVKGRARVETSGGGIEGVNLSGPVSAETSGGSVRLERVTGDLQAHSSGGGITIVEAGGRVQADTSGGSIEASFAKGNARGGSLETSGGGIEVSVDPDVGLEIDAQGNSVKTDLPIRVVGEARRRSLRGSLGDGGALLRLHTSGGGVRLRALR